MQTSKHPSQFKPSLTQARLELISQNLREVYDQVMTSHSTEDDCGYTRGTVYFGRARNRLINLAKASSGNEWLKLVNVGMDITLEIEGVPFRFFSENDHSKPRKKGFWRRNESDQLFAPTQLEPVIFRFITEKPLQDDDSLEVYFIGYNSLEEPVCEWCYNRVIVLTEVSDVLPDPVAQAPAKIELPRNLDGDEDASTKTASS